MRGRLKSARWATVFFHANVILLTLGACAAPMGRGSTVDVQAQTPATITIMYTHSYRHERQAAFEAAERHCRRIGRHAQLVDEGLGLNFFDRTRLTFNCGP